jgi:hypothetical protein
MRCKDCRKRINRRVYYFDNDGFCIDCFEDKCSEEFINYYDRLFTSVADVIYIVD